MDQSKFIYSTKKGSFIILISLMMIFNNFGLILATWPSKYRSTGFLGPTILGQIHWQKTLLHSQFRYHRWLNVQQRRKLFMVFMLNSVQKIYGVSKNQEILNSGLIIMIRGRDPGTDRSESVRDFQSFVGPSSVRSWILKFSSGPRLWTYFRYWSSPVPGFEIFLVLVQS